MRFMKMASVLFLSISFTSTASFAKSTSLIGSWRGGGIVQPTEGAKEKTRCRATIHKAPARGLYTATYKCSSSVGLITQSVTVKKTGSNRYLGIFHNPQHKVKGTISITLNGNNQTVTINSPEGQGWFDMQRQ